MPSPKELAAGLKAQEATSPNSKVMFVGQEHGKKTVLPDNVKKMAEKYGAYYEGAGGDKSDAVKYQGSWDDKASKEVKGYPKEFLYTLFTNSNVNNQKKNLTQPDKTIFDSALAAQDKWGYFKDRKFDADTLKQFLSASGMLDKSKQPATESNVKKFIDEGEGLMWPKNWEEYPNPAGKLAQKASEYRTNWLKSQKEGVYFVGSDHMKELNKPKEPAPSQLAKALAYRGEIRNTPQNSFLGGVANFLAPVSEFADQYKISDRIPFLGGMSAADLTGLKGAQSLVNDMSYGKSPISGASLQTTKVDPRVIDLAGVSGAMMPIGKALGKAALREGARQIETGTGVLGRNVIDPRQRMFAGEGAKTADHGALKVAKDMQAAGVPDEQIHAKTKWTFAFADGKPRFEIDDSGATIKGAGNFEKVIMDAYDKGLMKTGDQLYAPKVSDVMFHNQLREAYPKVMNAEVEMMPKSSKSLGRFMVDDAGQQTLGVNRNLTAKQAESTTLHELQHAIQHREGFAKGGSPEMFYASRGTISGDALTPEAQNIFNSALVGKSSAMPSNELAFRQKAATHEAYRRLAGEAEARLTQSRMNMTPAERAASYPPSMFDVPVKDQIVRYGDNVGGAMMQRPKPAGLLDYQIEHKPMTIEGGAAPLHDLAKSFGEDVYGKNALQYYGSGDARESGTLRLLQALRGKPDAQVTIYRGAPSEAGGINAGDWVTLDKRVAQDYVDQALASEGKAGKVFSQKVPASHITSWPDSLMEFGYHPK